MRKSDLEAVENQRLTEAAHNCWVHSYGGTIHEMTIQVNSLITTHTQGDNTAFQFSMWEGDYIAVIIQLLSSKKIFLEWIGNCLKFSWAWKRKFQYSIKSTLFPTVALGW